MRERLLSFLRTELPQGCSNIETRCHSVDLDPKRITLYTPTLQDSVAHGGIRILKTLKRDPGIELPGIDILTNFVDQPDRIPPEWRYRLTVFFFGTVFTNLAGSRFVCGLCMTPSGMQDIEIRFLDFYFPETDLFTKLRVALYPH